MHLKYVSYEHLGCIYWIKNAVEYYYNFKELFSILIYLKK